MIGAPDEEVFGEYVGEAFTDGPCVGWQDHDGTVCRQTWLYGEESGVPWVSDQRVAIAHTRCGYWRAQASIVR